MNTDALLHVSLEFIFRCPTTGPHGVHRTTPSTLVFSFPSTAESEQLWKSDCGCGCILPTRGAHSGPSCCQDDPPLEPEECLSGRTRPTVHQRCATGAG